MKNEELWNLICNIEGKLTSGTCLAKNFASNFLSDPAEKLLSFTKRGESFERFIQESSIVFAVRSQIATLNQTIVHNLDFVMPLKNSELIILPVLARISSLPCGICFSNSLNQG